MGEQLCQMFPPLVPPAPWDPQAQYQVQQLRIFFVAEWEGQVTREGEWQRSWSDGAIALGRKYVEVDPVRSGNWNQLPAL